MRILALDPGEACGFAVIEVSGDTLQVLDYGEIPILHPNLDGMLKDVWNWLRSRSEKNTEVAFEEFIPSQKIKTTREAAEVRGVIRLWTSLCEKPYGTYSAAKVRGTLGVKNKAEARTLVERLIGMKVRGRNHVADAFAVAICHALHVSTWAPKIDVSGGDFTLNRKLGGKKLPKDVDPEKMSKTELSEALRSGEIRVGRR